MKHTCLLDAYLLSKVREDGHIKGRPQRQLLETLQQRPQRRELRDEEDLRRLRHDHAEEPHDVGVLDRLHDLVLLHELERVVLHPLLREALHRNLVSPA